MFCYLDFNFMIYTAIGKSAGIKLKLQFFSDICTRQDDWWQMDAYVPRFINPVRIPLAKQLQSPFREGTGCHD